MLEGITRRKSDDKNNLITIFKRDLQFNFLSNLKMNSRSQHNFIPTDKEDSERRVEHKSIESSAHNASPHVKLNSFKIPPFESLWSIFIFVRFFLFLFYFDEDKK